MDLLAMSLECRIVGFKGFWGLRVFGFGDLRLWVIGFKASAVEGGGIFCNFTASSVRVLGFSASPGNPGLPR